MKLGDLNKNNIDMGSSRTVEGDSFEFSVPMNQRQIEKIDVDNAESEDDNDEFDINNIHNDKLISLLHTVKSWAPKRDLPDMRKVPNTANLI